MPPACVLCAGIGKGKMLPNPHPFPPAAGRKSWLAPRIMRVGELTFPLTSCTRQESRPYSLPGQHTKADLLAGMQVS